MRAVVIGAGLAGLAAGEMLAEAGAEVTTLEARDRVGGRVWSQRLANGCVVERGAEFVTDGYQLVPETAARLGLRLAPMGMSFSHREPRGGIGAGEQELDHGVQAVADAVAAGDGAGRTVSQLLAALPLADGVRELIACRIEVTYAHPAERIAAEAVRDAGHLFAHDQGRRIDGGNGQLAERLARGRVLTSTPGRSVSAAGGRLLVNGALEADAVVVAVPAPAVLSIAFDPPLPDAKRRALGSVVYGHAAKLAAPLAAPAPPSSVLSVPERFWTWTALDGAGGEAPVVGCFAGSQPALSELAVEQDAQRWLQRLAALRPDLVLEADGALLTTWPEGAYSTREGAGFDPEPAEPVGSIAFAGEHTEEIWFATMEGALRSGRRAASQLLSSSA